MVTFYIRLQLGIRLRYKSKSDIYSELIVVNVAEGWSENSLVEYAAVYSREDLPFTFKNRMKITA